MNTDPDRMVRKLWRLRERLNSPLSSIPYEVSGTAWATDCAVCHHEKHHTSSQGFERCSRCGSNWLEIESKVPKGKRTNRTNPMERAHHDLGLCVAILNHVPEPARTLYEYHLDPRGGGSRYAISAARELLHVSVSEYQFWSHIRKARDMVKLRLEFALLSAA